MVEVVVVKVRLELSLLLFKGFQDHGLNTDRICRYQEEESNNVVNRVAQRQNSTLMVDV